MAVINMFTANSSGNANVFTKVMGPVAREVLGKPTKETRHELRFRTRGSLSVNLDKGTYFDFEIERGGGVLDFLHSQLGLEVADAMAWLEARDFLDKPEPPSQTQPRREVATYDYFDANGELVFQVVRYEPKHFMQRRPDGRGGWIWKTSDIQMVLYRLPEVLAAVANERTVYVVEGEKSADRLALLGLTATCSPRGAGAWKPEYAPSLAGADIVILPDNDPQKTRADGSLLWHPDGSPVLPGQDHAMDVAKSLQGVARRVRILELPELPLKGDVVDWLNMSGDAAQLTALAESSAFEFAPSVSSKATTKPVIPSLLPNDLLDLDGLLGRLMAWIDATSIRPQPLLALAASLAAVGAVAGRRYRTSTNLRSNLYVVGIADSGGGKDHARSRIKAAFMAAGLGDYLGGEDIASGAAILTALHLFPCRLFQIDEYGNWVEGIAGKNASQHKRQIAERLKTIFSSANATMIGTEYADQTKEGKPRQDIIQPHVCLYGTTTPGQFWSALAGASLNDGFLARFLICVSPDSYPDNQIPAQMPIPDAIIEGLQAIAKGADDPEAGNLAPVMQATVEPQPYLVPNTTAADLAIMQLMIDQTAALRRSQKSEERAILARWAESAIKLALIRAISRNPAQPVIEAQDVEWGRFFAKHCGDTLLREAERNIADNDYGRHWNKCLDIVRREGKPLSDYEIARKGLKISARERADLLTTLVGSGKLLAIQCQPEGSGRATIRYAMPDKDTD